MFNYNLFVEKIEDLYHNFISSLRSIKYWISHRTYDRYHLVDTKLGAGYHDSDERMLHANFSILVDFIEVEKAWMNYPSRGPGPSKYKYNRWFFKRFRSAELGLEYLDWEMSGTSESQGMAAAEQKILYLWWTKIRPNREDPWEVCGYEALTKDSPLVIGDIFTNIENNGVLDKKTKSDRTRRRKAIRKCFIRVSKIEDSYHREDEKMLMQLVKIRRTLWV